MTNERATALCWGCLRQGKRKVLTFGEPDCHWGKAPAVGGGTINVWYCTECVPQAKGEDDGNET